MSAHYTTILLTRLCHKFVASAGLEGAFFGDAGAAGVAGGGWGDFFDDDEDSVVLEAGEVDGVDVCEASAQGGDGGVGVVEFLGDVSFLVGCYNAVGLAEGEGEFGQYGEGGYAAGEGCVKGFAEVGIVGEGFGAVVEELDVGEVEGFQKMGEEGCFLADGLNESEAEFGKGDF